MPFLTTREIVPRPFQRPEILHSLLERKNGSMPRQKKLFLYYDNSDIELIQAVVNVLKSLRINIYVDFPDPVIQNLHQNRDAEKISNLIETADKLIYLATPHGNPMEQSEIPAWFSRYMFDTSRSVIFPLTLKPDLWEKESAFSNCAFINKKFSYINFPDDWQVEFPLGKSMSLKDWILATNLR
jgi:hypothetical protein